MKKYAVSFILAIAVAMPHSFCADVTSTQEVTMKVGGTNLIKVMPGPGLSTTNVSLTLAGASEAGAAIGAVATDETTRLRMTSYTSGTNKRTISANLTGANATLWTGSNTQLTLELKAPLEEGGYLDHFANFGSQASGLAAEPIVLGGPLSTTFPAQTLVSNIGTAWSGTNAGDGYIISYAFSHVDQEVPATPVPGTTTVTFTISGD